MTMCLPPWVAARIKSDNTYEAFGLLPSVAKLVYSRYVTEVEHPAFGILWLAHVTWHNAFTFNGINVPEEAGILTQL